MLIMEKKIRPGFLYESKILMKFITNYTLVAYTCIRMEISCIQPIVYYTHNTEENYESGIHCEIYTYS